MTHCIIIGAGMAGLMAADKLQAAGVQVTILDKARGVGGRMATRRVENATFDHGAQYFTAKNPAFQTYVDQWVTDGIVKVWSQGFHLADGTLKTNNINRYIGVTSMNTITKHLASNKTIHRQQRAVQLDYQTEWRVLTEAGDIFTGNWLIMTPPAPQSIELLNNSTISLEPDVLKSLQNIQFDPCFAVMLKLDRPTNLSSPSGIWLNDDNLAWIADNHQKGISEAYGVTLHATPSFTQKYWETNPDDIQQILYKIAKPWLGNTEIIGSSVQRWRYSQPTALHDAPCILTTKPAPLGFAGDAFGGSRVEGAALSGMAIADMLLKLDR